MSPTNTARSVPDSRVITEDPGVCPGARSSRRLASIVYESSHSVVSPAS
jgi:hypothetical protein